VALRRGIAKHGEHNFDWYVVEHVDESVVCERESFYIAALDTLAPRGYNLLSNDDRTGPSEETRQRMVSAAKLRVSKMNPTAMSEQAKKQWAVSGYKEAASEKMIAFYKTDEGVMLKNKLSASMTQRFLNVNARLELSASHKRRLEDPETKAAFVASLSAARDNESCKQKLSNFQNALWSDDMHRSKILDMYADRRTKREETMLEEACNEDERQRLKKLFRKREIRRLSMQRKVERDRVQ
jgi:hypothetical protein